MTTSLRGIAGRPYLDLEPHLDLSSLAEVHDEVCLALTQLPVDYTGGSHRSMGIVPPSRRADVLVDYGETIAGMSDQEFATFRALSDDPDSIDPGRRGELEFGEEREHPLSRRQMLWLKYRFSVYFPWKVYVELIPNRSWRDKANAAGKDFTRTARALFPKTIDFVRSLPFQSIGRCNLMGLEAHDHGTVHRDGEPESVSTEGDGQGPDPFITICPLANKRLFLWDEEAQRKTTVVSRAYWFNDHDFHGVEADPFFRYSLRIDGVFRDEFRKRIHECAR
ncbi:MAG: hypothetical protein NVSMB47_01000 [Polyangiales bacterium]